MTRVPWLDDGDVQLYHGDVCDVLRSLPAGVAQTCATSPPYWGLRDYGTGQWEGGDADCDHDPVAKHAYGCKGCGVNMNETTPDCPHCSDRHEKRRINGTAERDIRERDPSRPDLPNPPGSWSKRDATTRTLSDVCVRCGARRVDQQLGLEASPELYVERMVAVFREVWRVLRDDGTLWLNIGDSYASGGSGGASPASTLTGGGGRYRDGSKLEAMHDGPALIRSAPPGLKPKDLVGIPWRVAFALQADGWYLRSDVIWSKPNPMPESVSDRPTKAHEYVFLLSKRPRYFYDADAVREQSISDHPSGNGYARPEQISRGGRGQAKGWTLEDGLNGRNLRSVWQVATEPFPEAHFATYPQALVRRCILAGTSERGECSECGAPRVRETSTEYENSGNRTTNGDRSLDRRHETAGFPVRLEKRVETTGWRATCSCGAPTRPQTVLDPFIGSGTTALVARKHGRRCIGIDLSDEYLDIAARRTQQLGLLGGAA